MNFDNSLFDNTPIEFKEINPEDFDSKLYNVVEPKEIIKPDDDGFISDDLLPILVGDLDNKNTTVINAGVGQGKTRAIIQVLTKYVSNPDYIIIIAVPYKSLVEQYVKECSEHISTEKIFNLISYEESLRENSKSKKWGYVDDELMVPISLKLKNYKVNVMTINALIGNPGDDNVFTSKIRGKYFKELKSYCESSNKKVIWLMDEIHDSIHNFKEQFIFNLWNFQDLVHKAYIISATFNEASKEVIKYVSEFTDKNIFIIESKRTPKPLKQSSLYLNFYINQQLDKDANLVSLVSRLVKSRKPFDILVYSKTLTEKLINPNKTSPSKVKKVSDVLKNQSDKINRCYSDAFNRKANRRYNEHKINIGTNFSTGINIEKLNHTLIIVFPKDLSVDYVNNKGVFTNGSNVIIQALARQRKKGDIYVFLPNPDGMDLKSLPYTEIQNKEMYKSFETYKRARDKYINYTSINSQDELLENAYKKLVYDTKEASEILKKVNRTGLNRLMYPTKEIFILNQGERYITKEFYGGDLSAYILWASISNQFLNCKLKSIIATSKLNFDRDNLFFQVNNFVKDYAEIDFLNSLFVEFNLFDSFSGYEKTKIVEKILSSYIIYIDNKKASVTDKNKVVLMMLSSVFNHSENFEVKLYKKDFFELYLKSGLFHSQNLQKINDSLDTRDLITIRIFKKWYELIDFIDRSKQEKKGVYRLPVNPNSDFEIEFNRLNFRDDLNYLINNEFLLSTDVFQFKNTVNTAIKNNTLIDSFYKTCIKIYYSTKTRQSSKGGKKVSYYEVTSIDFKNIPNLIYKPLPEVTL